MRYLRSTFYAKKGQAAKITFDQPVKIMLMPDRDFKKYKENSGTITYWGGYRTESPAVLEIPSPGTWHVIIELGWNEKKKVEANVELLDELPEGMRKLNAPRVEEVPETISDEEEAETAEETETA